MKCLSLVFSSTKPLIKHTIPEFTLYFFYKVPMSASVKLKSRHLAFRSSTKWTFWFFPSSFAPDNWKSKPDVGLMFLANKEHIKSKWIWREELYKPPHGETLLMFAHVLFAHYGMCIILEPLACAKPLKKTKLLKELFIANCSMFTLTCAHINNKWLQISLNK